MKKLWRSKINRRIVKSAGRLAIFSLLLVSLVNIDKIRPTNSAFMDNEISAGNTMTAGYWTPPKISIASPTSLNEWQVGSSHNITWTADSADPAATAGMEIDLDYSCDGNPWQTIIHNTGNDGTQPWTVPAEISDHCKIEVTAADSHGLTNSAESNIFKIKSPIVLNEFMLDPVGDDDAAMPGGEWVELYNNSATDIDAAGWYLYDSNDSHELQITAGNSDNDNDLSDGGETIVPANGWLVVYSNGDGDFALNNTGSDSVRLYDGLLATAHLADRYDYTVSHITGDSDPIATPGAINKTDGDINENSEGKSYARFPDGTGAWFDPIPTPGGENTKSLNLGKFIEYYSDRCVENDKAISIKKDPVCETNFLTELGILDKYGKISKDEQEVIPDKPDVSQTDALIEAPVSEEQNLASTDVNNEEIMAVDTASAVNGQSSDNPAANTNINSSAANPDPYLKKEEEISATLDAAILNNKSEDNSEKKDDSKDKIGGDGGSGDGSASKSIDSVIP